MDVQLLFLNVCSDFHSFFFFFFLTLERFCFPCGPVVNFVAIRYFKVYMSFRLNIFWATYTVKNYLMSRTSEFDINNLRSYIKNCDRKLDTFYRVA